MLDTTVEKRRLALGASGLSMNPDLVFGGNVAVGDVKYRHLNADWHRGDLNQVVAFATGFRCSLGLLLGFVRNVGDAVPRSVPIGPVVATAVGWIASEAMDPAASAKLFGAQVRQWLSAP